jgi:two-component system, cell cycle sensor histidine kinase and response regulator CckA
MFLGKTAGDIFGAEAAPIHEQANQRALAGENVVYEWMIRSPEGTRYFQTSLSPLHDSQEAIVGVVGIGREITERKREEEARLALERRLQEAKKLESLAALAGGIAHDFNNLLAIILGHVDLARFEIPPDSAAQELLPPIVGAVQRATALTQQMLAYSGRGHFQVERLDLNELLNEMREPLQAAIGGQAVLIYQLAPERLLLAADSSQIRQAILNLAINAAEAIGGARGSITIRTGLRHVDWAYLTETYLAPDLAEGRYVYLEVADTGSGMDDATRARIFEPFFTTKFMGRGLGLAAVLGIVRGHQGAIQVRSALGQGATFTLLFPIADDRPPPAEEPASSSVGGRPGPGAGRSQSPAPSGEGSAGGTVLIVDDEEGIRTMAARVLEQAGYSVLTAADGRAAVEVFRANADQIVCVLLDLMLPHTTGDVIFRQIRRIKLDICVILMSGYDEQEMTSRFAGQEPAGFLQKPFSPDQLREIVRRLLGEA